MNLKPDNGFPLHHVLRNCFLFDLDRIMRCHQEYEYANQLRFDIDAQH